MSDRPKFAGLLPALFLSLAFQSSAAHADQIDDLKYTIAVNPRDVDAWVALGQKLYRAGRMGETEWVMGQALAIDPDEPIALWLEGLSRYSLGDFAGAKTFLWRLYVVGGLEQRDWPPEIDRRPTYEIMGRLLLNEDDLFEADLFLMKACGDSNSNWKCLFLLGYVRLQRYTAGSQYLAGEAEEFFSRAYAHKPRDALILRYYARAKVVADQSHWVHAERARLDNLWPEAAADAAAAKRSFEGDEPLIQAAIRANPTNSFAYDLLGEYLAARGDFPRAVRALHKSIALDTTNVPARITLAKILLHLDPMDPRGEAEADLVEAIASDPAYTDWTGETPHIALLAKLLKRQGRNSKAVALEAWHVTNVPKEP